MANSFNYQGLNNILTQFATNHLSLRRYKMSFFEELDQFSTNGNSFPILYAVPDSVDLGENVDEFSFRLYCVDLLESDRSNQAEILNETLLILKDLHNWLRKDGDTPLDIINNPRAIPVNNFGIDNTVGFYMDVTIVYQGEGSPCAIPFSDNFLLTGITCSDTYINQFLTCETILACQGIIDITNRIDNLESIVFATDSLVDGNAYLISGLTFGTTQLTYIINGTFYSALPNTNLVISSGDSTYDRIDLIVADINGNVSIVQGTPSDNPVTPDISLNQIQVALVSVPAGSTSLATASILLYDENVGQPTEWAAVAYAQPVPNSLNANATNVAYNGTKSIRFSAVTNTTNFILTSTTAVTLVNENTFQFAIKNTAPWTAPVGSRRLRLRMASNSFIQIGNYIDLYHGIYGFSDQSLAWQVISIPLSAFAVPITTFGAVGFNIVNTVGNMSFNIDYVRFVVGTATPLATASWFNMVSDNGVTVVPTVVNDSLRLSGGTNITSVGTAASKNIRFDLDPNIVLTSVRANSITATTISATTYLNLPPTPNAGFSGWTGSTGLYSIKANNDTAILASGDYSVAEGSTTTASGFYSHAEGNLTTALGNYSHAEGNNTIASGLLSHSEGEITTASGYASHAEGEGTTASGDLGSHAEGNTTIAQGQSSHSEGTTTKAIGDNSHSEGLNTTATGNQSHTEGQNTTAVGTWSHSEGLSTKAIANASHAEGQSSQAVGNAAHAEGYGSYAQGYYSHAEGGDFPDAGGRSNGTGSHAEGVRTTADGKGSHAEGYGSIAAGEFSHAEGGYTDGVFTTFNGGYAIGSSSHAEGQQTTAIGDTSHSEGFGTTAEGVNSHSEGNGTKAIGGNSHAGGLDSIASGVTSFVHSTNSNAGGARSAVLGGQNIIGTADDTVYVPHLNLSADTDTSLTNILGLDVDGTVKVIPSSAITTSNNESLEVTCRNTTGALISKGSVVYVSGGAGNRPLITKAIATGVTTSSVIGIVKSDIANGLSGLVVVDGIMENLDTSAFTAGDKVYLSPSIAGGLTNVIPTSPNLVILVAVITSSNASTGALVINKQFTFSIDRLVDVTISGSSTNQSLAYNGSVWVNSNSGKIGGLLQSTGAYEFSGLTVLNSTLFNVGAAKGYIMTGSTPETVGSIYVNYTGTTSATTPFLSSSTATYFSITSASTLTMSSTEPTLAQRRSMIYLGVIGHPSGTLTGAGNRPDLMISTMSQLRDMFKPIRFINDGVIAYANTGMTFANTSGTLYGLGIGFVQNGASNPTTRAVAAGVPTTFQYRTSTGGTFTNTTTVSAATYEVGGIATPIPGAGNDATNQRIYMLENGNIRMQFGQTIYGNLAAAIAAAQTESFVVFSNFSLGILIGILSVTKNCITLTDTTRARFLPVSKFGETVGAAAGIAIGTLQQAYNNSIEPEILTDGTQGALTLKRGSLNDTDDVLQILNGSDVKGFAVNGNGGLTASTISATTYYNIPDSIAVTFDGAGGVISTGSTAYKVMNSAGRITGWDMVSSLAGNCVIDVWHIASGSTLPTIANTITDATKPTLTAQVYNGASSVPAWTGTTYGTGDIIAFYVQTATTVTNVNLSIRTLKQ